MRPPKNSHPSDFPLRPPKPSSLSPGSDFESGDAPAVPPRRRNSPAQIVGMDSVMDRISPNGVARHGDQGPNQPVVIVSDDGDLTPKGSPVFLKKPAMPSSDQARTAPPKHALAVRSFLSVYF